MDKLSYKELKHIFNKAKNGDEESFRVIYESTFRSQYFIAYNYLNNHDLAQEAVQNMYITFYTHLKDIKNDMAIIQWMNTSTINECKVLIRKEKLNKKVDINNYEDTLIDTKSTPEESYRCNEEKDILNKALDKLEPELKDIIIYRYVDNLKVKEIAKLTNLSTATVNRYIKAGTMKLRKHIANIGNRIYGIVLSPFMFKLFNDAMKEYVNNEQILDSYVEFAKNVAKVGTAATTTAAATKITIAAAKKGTATGTKIAAGSLGTVATIAVIVAVAISPNYTISTIDKPYVLSQTISLSSNNINHISSISCYHNDELIGKLNEENGYSIDIHNNGIYTIIIEDTIGKKHEENITIDNIDYECPTIDVVKKNDIYEATIYDNKSGIDYSKIEIINQDGQKIEYNINNNVITFTSSNPTTELSVYDNLGNKRKIILNNK